MNEIMEYDTKGQKEEEWIALHDSQIHMIRINFGRKNSPVAAVIGIQSEWSKCDRDKEKTTYKRHFDLQHFEYWIGLIGVKTKA